MSDSEDGLNFPAVVRWARARLAEGRAKIRAQHEAGSPGVQVSACLTDLLDEVVVNIHKAALAESTHPELLARQVAVAPCGGYGRRDVAPFSDVDVMLLYANVPAQIVEPFSARFMRLLNDSQLELGYCVRSTNEALEAAWKDAETHTSLVECRWLTGGEDVFRGFFESFRRQSRRGAKKLLPALYAALSEERKKHGESNYVLKPNVKRSRGGLRDIHLTRWVGFTRHGEADLDMLFRMGVLAERDYHDLRTAREFMLRLRNEMHFHARRPHDTLDKIEQQRVAMLPRFFVPADAECVGEKRPSDGKARVGTARPEGEAVATDEEIIAAVERFMRRYFEHASQVNQISENFYADAVPRSSVLRVFAPLYTHRVGDDFRVGPKHISATARGLKKLAGSLREVLRLMDLANQYDRRIDHETWRAIRASMLAHDQLDLTPDAARHFLSLLSNPSRLGDLLRRLHEARALEKIVPAMAHARCLVQFNEYHKYTVDEHCIHAVELAADFRKDTGLIGQTYSALKNKRILHLALLLHDLGKGFDRDHSEVGLDLARETAARLRLSADETDQLCFLVHKHLRLAHLAFWRNIAEDEVAIQLAREAGSPERLQMLFLLTCADMAAVGPGVLNDWKLQLIQTLYQRALGRLAVDNTPLSDAAEASKRREELRSLAPAGIDVEWWRKHVDLLPVESLSTHEPGALADDLRMLANLGPRDVRACASQARQSAATQYTIACHDQTTPGIFHKLAGALTSKGHRILSAEINTLADGLVLDRFLVEDLDYNGPPPDDRQEEVVAALRAALLDNSGKPPTFRRLWNAEVESPRRTADDHVEIDNNTSDRFTIVEVFAHDRVGLLYAISRALFELDLSVRFAKIGTHVDQVVDVFYVTDLEGRKVQDEQRLELIKTRVKAAT